MLFCDDESDPGRPVLPDGAAPRGHPPQAAAGRPSDPARDWCGGSARRSSTAWPCCTRSTTGRPGSDDLGKPQGYVERQVTGWTKRYQDAQTDDVPDLERTADWLAEQPAGRVGRARP